MPVNKILFTYGLTAVVFFIIDLAWLGLIAKGLYARYLGNFLADAVNWKAAILFYLLYIAGILIFASFPAYARNSWSHALIYGGLFGMIAYATYDLTNLATLKDWPLTIVIIDIIWGSVLTSLVSVSGFFIANWLNNS